DKEKDDEKETRCFACPPRHSCSVPAIVRAGTRASFSAWRQVLARRAQPSSVWLSRAPLCAAQRSAGRTLGRTPVRMVRLVARQSSRHEQARSLACAQLGV